MQHDDFHFVCSASFVVTWRIKEMLPKSSKTFWLIQYICCDVLLSDNDFEKSWIWGKVERNVKTVDKAVMKTSLGMPIVIKH